MSHTVEVSELPESEYDAWRDFVAASPDGSVYALPEYLEALRVAAGGSFRILVARRAGELVGGLPLYERRGRGGRWAGPRLLLYYLSPVLRAWETKYPSQRTSRQVEALGALAEGVESLSYGRVTLKWRPTLEDVRPFLERGWSARPSYTYVAPLSDLGVLRDRMEQNLRRLVDRCDRAGLVVEEDDDVSSFYRLHAEALTRQGAPPYLPAAAFGPFIRRLRAAGLCRLFHARAPGGAAAAMQLVLTGPHPVSHTVCAGADAEYQKLGASAFMRWKVFEALAAAGGEANDLTDAALNRVTHFKSQLGADLRLCHVVESPATARWRASAAVDGVVDRAKGLARRMLRPRREESE